MPELYPEHAVFLAPLADYSDYPFRRACRRFGCRYAFTPLIDAGCLTYSPDSATPILHRGPDEATTYYSSYMESALNYLKQKNQPIVVGGTQYEQNLYLKEPYLSLPSSMSPRVLDYASQLLINKLTPFPPDVSKWYAVGTDWVNGSAGMDMLQSIYPNPPKVIFLSNNESQRLAWSDAETDQRYRYLYVPGQPDNFKRQKFAEGWTSCYNQMFNGMRSGLNPSWNANSIFVGYNCL